MTDISYNEAQRRALLVFVQRLAQFELVAWERPDEDVVTMSKADAEKLLAILGRARELAERYSGLPL